MAEDGVAAIVEVDWAGVVSDLEPDADAEKETACKKDDNGDDGMEDRGEALPFVDGHDEGGGSEDGRSGEAE